MELRQLRYFTKAYELENFSEAARLLHISQSTLSQQIKQLEEELGILLFDRIGKRIAPTEAARVFLPFAHQAIQHAENGKQIIQDLKGVETGELHIGVTYSLGAHLIRALSSFSQAYPKIRIYINFDTSDALIELLDNNKLDFVLSFKPQGMYEHFDTLPICTSQLRFVVHASHPLAHLSAITLKQLAKMPLILPDIGFATRKKIDKLCAEKQLTLQAGVEMNDVNTIIQCLGDGSWGTILTEVAIRGNSNLVPIPISCSDDLSSQAFLFWPLGCYRKRAAEAFVTHLQQANHAP